MKKTKLKEKIRPAQGKIQSIKSANNQRLIERANRKIMEDWPSEKITPGQKVRHKANPSRIGIVGQSLEGTGRRQRVLVTFRDGNEEYTLFSALEPYDAQPLKPYEILKQGRFGNSSELRRSMTFHRLRGKLSNLIYSLNTTNTDFMPHQFKPVLNFLDSPSNGILIADEVGLGKTIEAGLIWTELKARVDARRLLVICPAVLREKWQYELKERFGVNAEIVNADELHKRLENSAKDPYDEFALIGSLQGLRPTKNYHEANTASAKLANLMDNTTQTTPLIDLSIIDEAHYLRNKGTQTNELGRLIREVSENLVMLSATPIQLQSRDLFNLLNILDEGSFPYETSYDDIQRASEPLIKLRKKILNKEATSNDYHELVKKAKGSRYFRNNKQIKYLLSKTPKNKDLKNPKAISSIAFELEKATPLNQTLTRTLKKHINTNRTKRMPRAIRVKMTPVEENFYAMVTEQVREYCETQELSTGFILTTPQRQMSSCMAAACNKWQENKNRQNGDDYETLDPGGELTEDIGEDEETSQPDSSGELTNKLVDIANSIENGNTLFTQDSKFNELLERLQGYCLENPDEKVVLFAFFKDTLKYLRKKLEEHGIEGIILHGGMNKNEVISKFRDDNNLRILLSSEAASEGVDLQFCSLLINYDLPWNPMRIEQRIGRIDRIGQEKDKILIWNFVYAETIDEKIYDRLLNRLEIFEGSLGDMEMVLGEAAKKITKDLFSHKMTKEEEEEKIEKALITIENNKLEKERIEEESNHLIAHGDFIQDQVKAAKDSGKFISGEDLASYVKDYFSSQQDGSRLLADEHEPNKYLCELSAETKAELNEYLKGQHLLGKTRMLLKGAPPLLFDNQHKATSPRYERVTQEHPLIRFITHKLSEHENDKKPYIVNAIRVNDSHHHDLPQGTFAFSIHMCSVSGALNIEKLEFAVSKIGSNEVLSPDESERLINQAAMLGEDWPEASNILDLQEASETFDLCRETAESRVTEYLESMQRKNDDRVNLTIESIEKRREIEESRIQKRIDELSLSSNVQKRKMLAPQRGKLEKTHQKFNERVAATKQKSNIDPKTSFVSCGVIKSG
ncbi:DEAD/DEAH box helicase [Halomonas sp. 18H]|nr:DEAD/DEAH box helicase [Halomonas sp. 18H]MCW4151013.1 DEAD/DEAH box helicase [Halomonas sp. 18H]